MTHRELYPEQYTHPICGKWVQIVNGNEIIVEADIAERVVPSRFGPLVILKNVGPDTAYRLSSAQEIV